MRQSLNRTSPTSSVGTVSTDTSIESILFQFTTVLRPQLKPETRVYCLNSCLLRNVQLNTEEIRMSLLDRAPDLTGSSKTLKSRDPNGISLAQISPTKLQDVSQPLPIVFNNVSLTIKSKQILTSVSGQAREGKLTALMVCTQCNLL